MLNLIVLPSYKDIFDDDPDDFIASIDSIPVQFVTKMCHLNTRFYFADNHNDLDDYIKNTVFGRALSLTKDGHKILNWMCLNDNLKILDSYTIQELYVILFSIDSFLPPDYIVGINDELLLLKLVLIANQRRMYPPNRRKLIDEYIDNNSLDDKFLQYVVWPNSLSQIDVNTNSNFIFDACHCFIMMRYLISLDKTKPIIEDFLKTRSVDSITTYCFYFTLIIQSHYIHGTDVEFTILAEPQVSDFLTPLCVQAKRDISLFDIKSHPVFRLGDFSTY